MVGTPRYENEIIFPLDVSGTYSEEILFLFIRGCVVYRFGNGPHSRMLGFFHVLVYQLDKSYLVNLSS